MTIVQPAMFACPECMPMMSLQFADNEVATCPKTLIVTVPNDSQVHKNVDIYIYIYKYIQYMQRSTKKTCRIGHTSNCSIFILNCPATNTKGVLVDCPFVTISL